MKNPNKILKMIQNKSGFVTFYKSLESYQFEQYIISDMNNYYLKDLDRYSFEKIIHKKFIDFADNQILLNNFIESLFK